jgi:ribosomal protein S3
MYLKYYIKKTLLSTLTFKNINFTFLKSWTYYGIFGIKVWFFF